MKWQENWPARKKKLARKKKHKTVKNCHEKYTNLLPAHVLKEVLCNLRRSERSPL